jgi:peptide/nickel transport system substrate-binding protein/oligopeptide transport system substrate-binding protein
LQVAGFTGGAAVLAACSPSVVTQVVNQTQIVNQTQVVPQTQIVNQTQIVQVPVTETPLPAVMTSQGKEMPADAAPLDKQIWLTEPGGEPTFLDGSRDIYRAGGLNLLTEPLLRNDENIQLVPALAESWKVDDTGKLWQFTLRQGAVWSDGNPITADDIVYTYVHAGDPKMGNQWISFLFSIKGLQDYALGTGSADAIGVKKVDDRTVTYEGQNGFVPYLPQLLAYQASVYCPKAVVEKDPEHWADTPEGAISSGPYLCTKWDHGKSIEFGINDKYNGPHKPYIQKQVGQIVPTGATVNAFNAWLNQEVDLLHILGSADLAAARSDPKLNPLIHFFPNFQSTYFQIDTFHPPMDNKDFRTALAKSIDRDTLTQQVFGGTHVTGHEMLPPGFPGYTDENKAAQSYDVDAAKAALAKSGINPSSVKLKLYSRAGDDDKWLQFIQQQWQTNLGVASDIIENAATWGQDRVDHKMQVNIGTYEYDFVDPSNLLTGLFHSIPAPAGKSEPWGSVRHNWKSDDFDHLVDAADTETDVAKRIKDYQDAQKILIDDIGVIFLAHQVVFQIWWPWLTGFHPDKSGNVVYRWLDIAFSQGYIRNDVDTLKASFKKAATRV